MESQRERPAVTNTKKKHLLSAPELRMSRIACVLGSAIPVELDWPIGLARVRTVEPKQLLGPVSGTEEAPNILSVQALVVDGSECVDSWVFRYLQVLLACNCCSGL